MSRQNYMKQIENRIRQAPVNQVFITADFLDIAGAPAVNKALSRLAQDDKIRRIIQGVYDLPQYSSFLDEELAPRMEYIAEAIARNFGWTIVPGGDTALNALGLSAQVPGLWQYASDGPYREYEIGHRKLRFKHTSNKNITGISYQSALVIQALRALGQDNINDNTIDKLGRILTEKEKLFLLQETQYGTRWIYEIAKTICQEETGS